MASPNVSKMCLDPSNGLINREKLTRTSFLRLNTGSSKRYSLQLSTTQLSSSDLDFSLTATEKSSKYYKRYEDESFDSMLVDTNWSLHKIMENSAATGMILKSDKPWKKTGSKLYQEFLEIIQSHSSEPQVFDTINDFIQICSDTLEIMRGMRAKVDDPEISDEEISLENERNTWRLIYCLYQNRIMSSKYQSHMETDTYEKIFEKDVIENLLVNESSIREYQLIIDWLEKNAQDNAEILPKIEHFTDKTIAWENTLHQLQNHQSGITFGSARPIVTSLDPDAPIREGKPLHDLDKEDDVRLEKRMFVEVRCGRLQKAQELAIHCGQPWRAACLLGWYPHYDPNYKNPLNDTKLPVEGNPNRSLWKLSAWHMSQDPRVGTFYRATLASLCGNINPLLLVSKNWQDALWANVKVLMDIEVESELHGTMAKSYVDMPEEYWKGRKPLEDIFDDLLASKDQGIRLQANKPDHLIQKYLILDEIPKLMEQIECWIDNNECSSQFIRFLAHLVLFLRRIGKNKKDLIGDKVLLAYVHVLIQINDPILIAFYTATLPQDDQVSLYALYLEGIHEHNMRKKCLSAAEDANLNVEAITKTVVENIRRKNVEEIDKLDNEFISKINDSDLEKINALDWLTFYQSQREEALWQANALIRYFLTCDKLDAARQAFNKIPNDTIEIIMVGNPSLDTTNIEQTTSNDSLYKSAASIREYLCFKAYLDAHEGFQEWFHHFHQGKPTPLEPLSAYPTFTEKVAYDHKKKQYDNELEQWKLSMQHHTKAVEQLLFNVLLFPDGGWLVDINNLPSQINYIREVQLEKLRNLCIPKITLLLLTVMSEMNEHSSCIELADIIASEQYQLYKVFSKERLREIYKKICESSVVLMDQKKDPWGYPK